MVTVHVMVGIPGSGKSTWIKNYTDTLNTLEVPNCHISRDQIRFSLIEDEDDYFKYENQVFAEFIRQINEAIAEGIEHIYVDQTSLSAGSRKKLLSRLQPGKDTRLTFDVMKCCLGTALNRNETRTGRENVPIDTIISMYNGMTIPNPEAEYIKDYGFCACQVRIHDTETDKVVSYENYDYR